MNKIWILFTVFFLSIGADSGNAKERPDTSDDVYVSSTELFLMRASETRYDRAQQLSSSFQQDITLTEEGYQQAEKCAHDLQKRASIDYIICSPLVRARQTAFIIVETLKIPARNIIIDDRLREQYFGSYERRTQKEYIAQFEQADDAFLYGAPGAESGEQVSRRVTEFLREMATSRRFQGRNVLIITHGYPLCHIAKRFTENWQEMKQPGEYVQVTLASH